METEPPVSTPAVTKSADTLLEAALAAANAAGDMDWSSEDGVKLTFDIITAIEADEDAKNALFPGHGSNPRTGGKSKTNFHRSLAVTVDRLATRRTLHQLLYCVTVDSVALSRA
ncbi:unnamed protein product [Mycena citricolor]|uniref:Uncharacterized protein n=1 Tax=Mycena citricolor TaxID=2018698 RepID=A0AAD2HBT0_9AGAR|nr:unnamed protein product [Mycena citricolor]